MLYEVTFDRVGRTRGDEPIVKTFRAGDEDGLSAEIYSFALTRLASNWPSVVVRMDDDSRTSGDGSIEGGRYGSFTFRAIEEPAS